MRAGDNPTWEILTASRTKTEKDIGPVARSPFHRHVQTLSSFFHTSFPLTHVLSTFPLRSRTTKSASAPARSVPFQFSMPRHRAGLKVTHFIASPSEHPVNREKFRTQLSRVTTLRQIFSCTRSCVGDGRDAPASEGVGALKIQLGPFLHETLAVAPLMYSVF